MMINEKKKISLLLLQPIFAGITMVICLLFIGKVETDFLAKNLIYQVIGCIMLIFIYYNLSTLRKEFKIVFGLVLAKCIDHLLNFLILSNFISPNLLHPFLIDAVKFVSAVLEIPFAYFLYKGLTNFVIDKIGDKDLANKWNKMLVANMILSVWNFIIFLIRLFGILQNGMGSLLLMLLISLFGGVLSVVISVLQIVYIIKTVKQMK